MRRAHRDLQRARAVKIFGTSLLRVSKDAVVAGCCACVKEGVRLWLTMVNVSVAVKASQSAGHRRLLRRADARLVDGRGLVWASSLLGAGLPETISGPFLLFALLERAAADGWSVYVLGGTELVAAMVAEALTRKMPLLKVVGIRNGFFGPDEEPQVMEAINRANPDLLIVGMGFPRERAFICRHLDNLSARVILDVGGALTVLAGVHSLAPRWVSHLGLEWTWRLIQEPRRLGRAYVGTHPRFGFSLPVEVVKRCRRRLRVGRRNRTRDRSC